MTIAPIFPFMPNWRDSYKITYEFRTDILVSRAGKEQRRALRQTPRKTIEYTATLVRDKLLAFERLLNTSQCDLLSFPEDPRGARTTAALAAGGNSVAVASIPAWLVNGLDVILIFGQQIATYVVSSASGPIVFTTNVAEDWPVGTRICQALSGRLMDTISGGALTTAVSENTVQFQVDPGSEVVDEGTAGTMFLGFEVFPFTPNWISNVDLSYSWPRDTLDYGMGRIAVYKPIEFGTVVRQPTFLGRTTSEIDLIRQFYARKKGQWKEFYFPTGQADIVLASQTDSGSATLVVAGTELYDAYAGDTVHQALQVQMPNGTQYNRGVTGITTSGGNSIITISVNAPVNWPVGTLISWMPRARFASDQMTVEYLTDSVAQTKLSIQTLETLW